MKRKHFLLWDFIGVVHNVHSVREDLSRRNQLYNVQYRVQVPGMCTSTGYVWVLYVVGVQRFTIQIYVTI